MGLKRWARIEIRHTVASLSRRARVKRGDHAKAGLAEVRNDHKRHFGHRRARPVRPVFAVNRLEIQSDALGCGIRTTTEADTAN